MTQDQSELNKLIIQMLLQNHQGWPANTVDVDRNYEINRDLGIQPSPVDTYAPSYNQPFRQKPPGTPKWFGWPS